MGTGIAQVKYTEIGPKKTSWHNAKLGQSRVEKANPCAYFSPGP